MGFRLRALRLPLILARLSPLLASCGDDDAASATDDDTVVDAGVETKHTYFGAAKAVLEKSCVGCHVAGGAGPFPLDTFESASAVTSAIQFAVESGSMPPWKPADACNTYQGDFSLSEDDKAQLLGWIRDGAMRGEEREYAPVARDEVPFAADVSMQLAEAYLPQGEPDDYRCFVVPWNETTEKFVTGFEVTPDVQAEVHHVILYRVEPERVADFEAMDAAEEGPGYTCYGGPVVGADMTSAAGMPMNLGGWVPGTRGNSFPEGVGIKVEPGSAIVVQMHYNTSHSEPEPDQTRFGFSLADTVERPALSRLITDPKWIRAGGMPIPAGEANVHHRTEIPLAVYLQALGGAEIGLAAGSPYVLHRVNMHMHELGTRGRVGLLRGGEDDECLLDIPEWDFHWQGAYTFEQAVTVQPGDTLTLECWWDNSVDGQPSHGAGPRPTPIDVEWGEGTRDEMCLTGFLVTAN